MLASEKVEEPPRIFIKIPALNYHESIVIKNTDLQGLDGFVEFCHSQGAPESYAAFEMMLLKEYIHRNSHLSKKGLKEMIGIIIDKELPDKETED